MTDAEILDSLKGLVRDKLKMEGTGRSSYPKGRSVANRALLGAGLEMGNVMVLKETNTESGGRKAKYVAFGTRPTKTVDEDYPTKRRAASSSSSSSSSTAAAKDRELESLQMQLAGASRRSGGRWAPRRRNRSPTRRWRRRKR